jgi:hypothetical protein
LGQKHVLCRAELHQLATARKELAIASKKAERGWLLATSSPRQVLGEQTVAAALFSRLAFLSCSGSVFIHVIFYKYKPLKTRLQGISFKMSYRKQNKYLFVLENMTYERSIRS